ncbi:hypothetical protein KB213_04895 [Neokomagataea sp. TBRC 2177]|uniref:YfhO family protein n=1 Tax=Neokomagataea anthophila TaxID=2826925 RepID=A0ABS5E655_9PROT|nr:hypothetical protein [Neokomagataea anthophila]
MMIFKNIHKTTIIHYFILILCPIALYVPEWLGVLSSDPLMTSSTLLVNAPNFTQGGFLPGNPGWIDGCAGVFVEALGRLVSQDWLHGIIPWWNPYSGVGMPLAGEYQPAAFFLPFILYLALPNGLLMMKCTLQIIAGLSTYTLLKKIRLDARVALVGGLLYAFNGTYAWASDGPSEPLAFLPLALYGVERAREGRWGWLALGLAYLMLSGFPETAYLLGLLVLGWAILRFFQSSNKYIYTKAIIIGGFVAGFISSPQLLAFASYLPNANIGSHSYFNDTPLPHEAWSMLFFPYINGTFFYASQFDAWYALGGYCGVVLPFCAFLGLMGRKDRALRWVLCAFVVFIFGKQANIQPFVWFIDHIPEAAHTVFYRLCEPVVEACLIVLSCFALDDATRGEWRSHKNLFLVAFALILGFGYVLYLDMPMLHKIRPFSEGPISSHKYMLFSIIISVVELFLFFLFYKKRSSVKYIFSVLLFSNIILFAFPLLSARPERSLDKPFLEALRAETKGFQRFATLGPVEPNYGVYLNIPSLNFNAIPTPKNWIIRLKKDFGSGLDPVTFNGFFPSDENGNPFLLKPALSHPEVFEALGVSALVVPVNGMMVSPYALAGRAGGGHVLSPDKSQFIVDIAEWHGLWTQKILVQLGTYVHQSDGDLKVSFCSDQSCAHGVIALKDAQDNAFTAMTLDQPIPPAAKTLTFSLVGATRSVMLWGSFANGVMWPSLRFEPLSVHKNLTFVTRGAIGDLYRFQHPAPYFEADSSCSLQVQTRDKVSVLCSQPARLIRREFMMPGWRAFINNKPSFINETDDIFQEIMLPKGKSDVQFYFAPPYAKLSWFFCLIGVLALIGEFMRSCIWGKRKRFT